MAKIPNPKVLLQDSIAKLNEAKRLHPIDPQACLEKADTSLEQFLKYYCIKNGSKTDTSVKDKNGSPILFGSWGFTQCMQYLGQREKMPKNLGKSLSKVHAIRNPSRHSIASPTAGLAAKCLAVVEYAIRSDTGEKKTVRTTIEGGSFKLPKLRIKVVSERKYKYWEKQDWYLYDTRGKNNVIKHKRYKKWELFEIKLRQLFQLLDFGDRIEDIEDFNYTELGSQVDVCGGFEGTFFVIDCTSKTYPGSKNLKTKIGNISAKRNAISKKIDSLYSQKYHAKVFALCTEDIDISPADRKSASDSDIILITNDQVERWFRYYKTLGAALKYHIIKGLAKCSPVILDNKMDPFFRFHAFRLEQGNRSLYYLLAEPEAILKLAYVYRLDMGDPQGYQRDLKRKKLLNINGFLAERDTYFANNLVISFDMLNEAGVWPDFEPQASPQSRVFQSGVLAIPKLYCSAEVIDGQHRLYGYLDATDNQTFRSILRKRRAKDRIPVVAVADPDQDERARLFTDINSNQTKVEVRSLWVLMTRVRPGHPMGYAGRVVLEMHKRSTFKNEIQIPGITRSKKKLNIANLGKGLMDRKLLDKDTRFAWNLYRGDRRAIDYSKADAEFPAKTIEQFYKPFSKEKTPRDFTLANNGFNVMIRVFAEWLKFQHHINKKIGIRMMASISLKALETVLAKHGGPDALLKRTSNEAERANIAMEIMKVIIKRERGLEGFAAEVLKRRY